MAPGLVTYALKVERGTLTQAAGPAIAHWLVSPSGVGLAITGGLTALGWLPLDETGWLALDGAGVEPGVQRLRDVVGAPAADGIEVVVLTENDVHEALGPNGGFVVGIVGQQAVS